MKARWFPRFGVLAVTVLWVLSATVALGQTPPSRPQPNDVRVLVQGRYAYVADAHGYPYTIVRIIDIADPTHPVQVGAHTSGVGEYDDLAVNGAYAYLSHGGYAQIDTLNVS